MARTARFGNSAQAVRARRNKILLLPLPRSEADRLCLEVHIALDAMRRRQGNALAAQTLCQAMILTGLLAEAGYGEATFEQMRSAETVIVAASDRGRECGEWYLDDHGFAQFAVIATTYDAQLRRAPLAAIADAHERLTRFRSGDGFHQA